MGTVFTLFMVLIMILSVLLVIIIMAQNPKGGGLSGTFGGTSPAQFGVQRTNDFMENATWTLGALVIILIIVSVVITAKPSNHIPAQTTPTNQSAPVQTAPVKTTAPIQQAPAKK
ncbi:preprotein translocase subunit SecG [Halpernia sp.]|uniref:preprotein translocase subunit SecG n=1 Tax=Halpernia sp. TaxID=2782209 RepID=UPI003A910ECD